MTFATLNLSLIRYPLGVPIISSQKYLLIWLKFTYNGIKQYAKNMLLKFVIVNPVGLVLAQRIRTTH